MMLRMKLLTTQSVMCLIVAMTGLAVTGYGLSKSTEWAGGFPYVQVTSWEGIGVCLIALCLSAAFIIFSCAEAEIDSENA